MLESVKRPDGTEIRFEYDALGRRTAKINEATKEITRFVWDGNVPLHEWKYNLSDRPKIVANELGELSLDKKEPTENLITWIFDEGSFVPSAKITKEDTFSIVSDYLGTPCLMYNSVGNLVWQADLDIYGKVRTLGKGNINDCPFRYQGQYHDTEVDLYYNRFRYYSPESGMYISQDPIGLAGNNLNVYAYVKDVNSWLDKLGLNVTYFSLDALGRPTGGIAEVTQNSLGTGSDAAIDPPGWQGGAHPHHQQRGHLIANNHGGRGTDTRNIVTITDGTNHPGMTRIENTVTRHVRAGNTVVIEVKPNYTGNNLVPDSISMYAIDQNGLRQNTACCR